MNKDEELSEIRKMIEEYKSMPSSTGTDEYGNYVQNIMKTGLHHRIEMKMKAFEMTY